MKVKQLLTQEVQAVLEGLGRSKMSGLKALHLANSLVALQQESVRHSEDLKKAESAPEDIENTKYKKDAVLDRDVQVKIAFDLVAEASISPAEIHLIRDLLILN